MLWIVGRIKMEANSTSEYPIKKRCNCRRFGGMDVKPEWEKVSDKVWTCKNCDLRIDGKTGKTL